MIKHSLKNFVTQVKRFDLLSDEELSQYNEFLQDENHNVLRERTMRIPGKEAVVSTDKSGQATILEEAEEDQLIVLVTYSIHRDLLGKEQDND